MKIIEVQVKHNAPLLLSNRTLLDPLNPLFIEAKPIKNKRKKSEADQLQLKWIDFQAHLYWGENGTGAYIPSEMMVACIREGAKNERNGTKVPVALMVNPETGLVPIIYPNPASSVAQLYKDPEHSDYRPVGRNTGTMVLCCRPRFNEWSLKFDCALDEFVLDPDALKNAIIEGGKFKAIGAYRPYFGRFTLESFEVKQ